MRRWRAFQRGALARGPGMSELAGELALAIEMAATAQDLALTIHPHPTVSEALGEAAWSALHRPRRLTQRAEP